MPSLGADMETGTLVEWLKHPGDSVSRGDIVAVVETQKGAIEIEIFDDGVLSEIKVEPGNEVPVGTLLALIAADNEAAPTAGEQTAAPSPTIPETTPIPEPRPQTPVGPASVREAGGVTLRITPVARREAKARGIDVQSIAPGPSGVIGLREVEAAGPGSPENRSGLDLGEMRKAIAAAMTRSHREIPHYWVGHTIDVTPLFQWLEAENRRRSVAERLLYIVPIMRAVALAAKETTALNGHFSGDVFLPSEPIHIGIVTALRGGGLVAPALRDIDKSGVDEIRVALGDLIPRARAGRLRSSELTDATISLSSLGEATSDILMPLIYPPQVAIVGCGAPIERPHIVEGQVVVRRLMTVTVAGDHRVSDGRSASQFLGRLGRLLEKPEEL